MGAAARAHRHRRQRRAGAARARRSCSTAAWRSSEPRRRAPSQRLAAELGARVDRGGARHRLGRADQHARRHPRRLGAQGLRSARLHDGRLRRRRPAARRAPWRAISASQRVLVPPAPGILCALGLLVEPLRLRRWSRTRVALLDAADGGRSGGRFEEMEQRAAAGSTARACAPAPRRLRARVRHALPRPELRADRGSRRATGRWRRGALRRAFLARARAGLRLRRAGRARADRGAAPHGVRRPRAAPEPGAPERGERRSEGGADRRARRLLRGGCESSRRRRSIAASASAAGHRLPGPAIVEQMDSTTVILLGQEAPAWTSART